MFPWSTIKYPSDSLHQALSRNHYWTMMFYGDGDQVTLDRNYFHDVSGRAPKLGEDSVSGTFVSHILFSYMQTNIY